LSSNKTSKHRHEPADYCGNHRSFHANTLPFTELYLL
jgi:hypothetical protein